jgi:hypothetical protein
MLDWPSGLGQGCMLASCLAAEALTRRQFAEMDGIKVRNAPLASVKLSRARLEPCEGFAWDTMTIAWFWQASQ